MFLDVPIEVKLLLKSDSIKKNMRVHFPNGEWTDLINKDLVGESLEFTENLISGDRFTLGLMESPVIKFETISISNVKNAIIEVYIEVFCDSTVPDAVQKADLNNAWVYPIPMGRFTVTDCDLQADLEHRIITAYSTIINDDVTKMAEYVNSVNHRWDDPIIPVSVNADDLIKMQFGNPSSYSESITNKSSFTGDPYIFGVYDIDGTEMLIELDISLCQRYEVYHDMQYSTMQQDNTYRRKEFTYYKAEGDFNDLLALYGDFLSDARSFIFDTSSCRISPNYEAKIMNVIQGYCTMSKWTVLPITYNDDTINANASGHVIDLYPPGASFETITQDTYTPVYERSGSLFNYYLGRYDYPKQKDHYVTYSTRNKVYIPTSLVVEIKVHEFVGSSTILRDSLTLSYNDSGAVTSISIERDQDEQVIAGSSATSNPYDVNFPRDVVYTKQPRIKQTYNSSREITDTDNVTRKEYGANIGDISKFKIRDLIGSYAELQGKVARIDRFGNLQLCRVDIQTEGLTPSATLVPSDTLYPQGANGGTYFPINYITCWYDDLTVRQFGRIVCNYNNEDGENAELIYNIVDDFNEFNYKTYTITNNWILNNSRFSESDVLALLATMGANIKNAAYVPSKIEMQGRPDIEVGQFINVVTTSGSSFNTLLMRRTIKGIQALKDAIENNPKDDASGSSSGGTSSGGASSGGVIPTSGVKTVNGYTGNVNLKTSDIPNDTYGYSYNSTTKTILFIGLNKV